MKILKSLSLLLVIGVLASVAFARPRPEILGITHDMTRDAARTRLQSIGTLEKEDRKRQEFGPLKIPASRICWSVTKRIIACVT